jgi:putative DNA primase/helicase
MSVPRKHQRDYTAKLSTRFLVISNEVPAFFDQSGALASRFIVLRLTQSFFGREDRGLEDRLRAELPGILLWALAGLDRSARTGSIRTAEVSPRDGAAA